MRQQAQIGIVSMPDHHYCCCYVVCLLHLLLPQHILPCCLLQQHHHQHQQHHISMAWLSFVKLNGVAPTAPGQWPSFLAFYAGKQWSSERVVFVGGSAGGDDGWCVGILLMLLMPFPSVLSSVCLCCHLRQPLYNAPSAAKGFWAVQNFVRPLRISLALALAPAFDKAITNMGEKLNIPKGW